MASQVWHGSGWRKETRAIALEIFDAVSALCTVAWGETYSVVKSNQVIAEIDPSVYQAALEQAKADLANARANAELQRVEATGALPCLQTSSFPVPITAISPAAMSIVQQEITSLLMQRHHLKPGGERDFIVRSQEDIAQAATGTARVMGLLLAGVAAVSLVVGGIGIMNIMLVSVTEPTREIGIRVAVGARGKDILRQFLIEAPTLSVLGGGIGIASGMAISHLVASLTQWPTFTPVLWIGIASLSSGIIGIISGFYPAWKASKLDPIHALRYE